MIKKRYLILILCIITILSIQFVSANDNTDNMTVLGVSGEESILQAPSETQSYTDLNTIINQAGEGDEINLTYNYEYRNGNDPKTGINITKNLVINGNGATIDGKSASSLFNISEGVTVTLKNLTIKNSAAIESSEVFYRAITSEGNLNIYDCTFDSNAAGQGWEDNDDIFYAGSVIYSSSNINIINSSFSNNVALNGGIIYSTGTIRAKNSYFYSNKAISNEYSDGGVFTALVVDTIENCTFKNNFANAGGSISIYGGSTTSIKNSTFEGSISYSLNGGAIFNHGSADLLIENSTFKDFTSSTGGAIYIENSDSNIKIRNSILKHLVSSSSYGGGGAIYTAGNVEIENTTMEDNSAINGGVVYAKGSITFKDCNKISSNGVISSTLNGGVVYALGNVIIDNSSLTNNKAHDLGGAIYALGSVTVNNSNVSQNSVSHYEGKRMAGAIYAEGNVIIENSTVSKNSAYYNAGAVYSLGSVTVKNSTISDNIAFDWQPTSPIRGGAIYANGNVLIENTSLIHNVAKDEGGAVYTNSTITIKNSNNLVNNGIDQNGNLMSKGGLFYAKGDVIINNTEFSHNYADLAGGAVYSEGNVNFYNSKVDGSAAANDGNGDGGFIYAEGNVNIENSTIESVYMKVASQSYHFSGAVFTEGNIVVKNSNFTKINKEIHSIGGAIRAFGNAEIYNSNFTDNKAVKYAALYVNGTLDVYDSYFYNNSDSVAFAEDRVIVNNTQFINNTCGISLNGRVLGSNSTLNLTNSVIDGTYSHGSQFKGSVFADDDVFVDNCNFTDSFAFEGGSRGLLIYTNSDATVLNSYFNNNSYRGHTCFGGIYTGQNAYVENCTFTNATVIGGEGQTEGLAVYAEHNISFINSSIEDFFSRNTPEGALSGNYVYVIDSNFTDIKGFGAFGAAIHANVANVTNCNFYLVNSSDNKDNGGAIYANNTYAYGNNFTECHAGRGGAIYSENYTVAIENIFVGNFVQYSGGAIATNNGFIEYNVLIGNGKSNAWGDLCDVAFFVTEAELDSLELNWWGHNDPFKTMGENRAKTEARYDSGGKPYLPGTWVIMEFYITNPDEPFIGQGLNLTTALERYYNNTNNSYHDLNHDIAKRTVIYNSTNNVTGEVEGNFSHNNAVFHTKDYVLYSNNNFNLHNVSSTVDYQTLYLKVRQFEINVTKTVTNTTPKIGDIINYTITVRNNDTTDYSDPSSVFIEPPKLNVTITDILDNRLKLIGYNDTNFDPATGNWFIEDFKVNSTRILVLRVKVTGFGNITNFANVTKINDTELPDPYGSANVTIYVNESTFVELNVTKTANATNIYVGDKIEFTIAVNNTGTSNATNVKVWDILPAGFELVSGGHYDTSTRNLTFDAVDIEAGKQVSFVFVVRAMADGKLNNTAFAHADENETIFNGTSDNITVNPDVRLTVNKTVNVTAADVVHVGDKLKYTIIVKNVGLSTATVVNVTDVVDSSLVEVVTGEFSCSW